MKKLEEELVSLKGNMTPLSTSTKRRLAAVYQIIESETTQEKPNGKKQKRVYLLIAAAIGSLIVAFSPVGEAIGNFLGFGVTASQTLKDGNFVIRSLVSAKDQETKITLEELYRDEKEIGFHFVVDLPDDSPLLREDLTDFSISFAVLNAENDVLLDFNSGIKAGNSFADLGSFTGKSHLDSGSNRLEVTYKFDSHSDEIPNLDKSRILITKLTGMNAESRKAGDGFQNINEANLSETIEGKWELPLTIENGQEFPTLHYKATDKELVAAIVGSVTPTTFTIDIDSSALSKNEISSKDIWLSDTEDGKGKSYNLRETSKYEKNNKEYYRLIFDYSDYDFNDSVIVHISDLEFQLDMVN